MRRKRGFIFLSRCCLDSLAFCGGTGSGDAVKTWSLHLASYWLHIQAIIENTLINYLFQRIIFFFSIFHAGQVRLKGMFQVLSGSILQLLLLRARGVSWWKTKSLGWAALQNVLFATFPGREYTPRASQTSRCGWQDGIAGFQRGQGASHLPQLLRTSDHSECLLIWDLET